MDPSTVSSIDIGSFSAEVRRMRGTADLTVKTQLDRLLCDIHSEMAGAGATHVSVDVSGVDFMNSACLKAFVTWVTAARELHEGRYQITFLFRPDIWWQRRSLNPIVALSDGVADTRPSESR